MVQVDYMLDSWFGRQFNHSCAIEGTENQDPGFPGTGTTPRIDTGNERWQQSAELPVEIAQTGTPDWLKNQIDEGVGLQPKFLAKHLFRLSAGESAG